MSDIEFSSDITVKLIQSCGGDHSVVAAAKVSTSGEEALEVFNEDPQHSEGLINYLIKHRHSSVFEHSSLTFFTECPIFVYREWHRHRVMSFNETSGRYTTLKPKFYIPSKDRPLKPADNYKPARPQFVPVDGLTYQTVVECMKGSYKSSYSYYEELLNLDIAKEIARAVLPVGIYSQCWVTCNPRALMHFLSLRIHDPAAKFVSYPQYEIELAAKACEEMFSKGWPLTYKAFINNGRVV